MLMDEQLQRLIHNIEVGSGRLWVRIALLTVVGLALAGIYDLTAYRSFNSQEAMDAAQVARQLKEGKGYTTEFVRPFSLYLMRKHNLAAHPEWQTTTNADLAQITRPHPDLANPPVYPTVLAGLFAVTQPDWKAQTHKPFWSAGDRFARYAPEFYIALFNQFLLLVIVMLTFQLAKTFFDTPTAWLAAGLTFVSDGLWKFSISGQSTLLLLVIFLGLAWCLAKIEIRARTEPPDMRRLFLLAVAAGALTGLGLLTRYSFGWVMVPVVIFLAVFGGSRRSGLAVVAFLTFAGVIAPWIVRNLVVSGTFFGTAGYAVVEGTGAFPGSKLMQSVNPDLSSAYWIMPYVRKFFENVRYVFQGDLLRLGGGVLGILFFAGLLLGLQNAGARRLRYFTMGCLGIFILVQSLGRTQLSDAAPELNSENLFILLSPLVVIFGVAAFVKLLDQMELPSLQLRYWVAGVIALIASLPLIITLLPPKTSTVAYPPYYPPEIQKISNWMRPDELMMSDIPWAVAWYGHRQCTWTTLNTKHEFFSLNDNLARPVRALYLTLVTLDGKLFSDCLQGGVASWGVFVLKSVTTREIPPGFPLRESPYGLSTGLVLTDRVRWETQ